MRPFLLLAMVGWLAIAEAAIAQPPTWLDANSRPSSDTPRSTAGEPTVDFLEGFAQRLQTQRITRSLSFENTATSWETALGEEDRRRAWLWDATAGWNPWLEGFGNGGAGGHGDGLGIAAQRAGSDTLDDADDRLSVDAETWLKEAPSLNILSGYCSPLAKLDDRSDSGQFSFSFQRDADDHYVTKRQITIGSISQTANAAFAPKRLFSLHDADLNRRNQNVHKQPYQALEYIRLEQDAVTERGTDSLDLSVGTDRGAALRSLVGSRVQGQFHTEAGRVTVEGRAAWRHEFLVENEFLEATFSHSGGSSFTILSGNIRRDAAILGPGLTFDLTKSLRFCANYDVLLDGASTIHAGSGGIESVW